MDIVKPKSLSDAIAKSSEYQKAARAPSTMRAYATDTNSYSAWCEQNGIPPYPAEPYIVGAYLAEVGAKYANSTLRRRVAAIARASAAIGHPLDTKRKEIHDTLQGIAREHDKPIRQAAALTVEEIQVLCIGCEDDLRGLRDRALFLLGFAGAFRRSELVGLDVLDLSWTPDGLTINIRKSKTDTYGQGEKIGIPCGKVKETCPVFALRSWLVGASITNGPLFRKVNKGGNVQSERLCPDAVRQILAKRASQAGMQGTDSEPISPHGMRAGFVTTAFKNGVSDEDIMAHTRHRSLGSMRGYIRRSKLGALSPAGKIGL